MSSDCNENERLFSSLPAVWEGAGEVTDTVVALNRALDRNAALISVFETLPDTYFRIGLDGTILDYKAQPQFDLYLPPQNFLGRRIHQVLPESVARLWDEHAVRLRHGEPGVSFQYELPMPDGSQSYEARLSPLPGSDDTIAVVRNITDRCRAEERLQESNRRLEEAQSIAHIGSWTFDIAVNRATWTPEVYHLFGVDPARFVPTIESVGRCMHPEDRERYQSQVELWLTGTNEEALDLRILRPDGAERILSSRAKAMHDAGGRVTHLVGTVQDVTEQRRFEQALHVSETRFRRTVELSWDMLLVFDENARITYVNDAVERILGFRKEEFIGMTALDIVHPEERDFARGMIAKLLANPSKSMLLELRGRHRDGRWIWFEIAARNLLNEPGLAGIVSNMRDVTERRFAEDELHVQEQRFRALIEHSTDAIVLVTADGIITYASPGNAHVLGYLPEDMLGLSMFEFIAPDSREALEARLAVALLSPGEPVSADAWGLKRDGSRNRLEGHLSNLLDVPGVTAVVINYRDVTERESQREALERAHRKADTFRRMVELASQAIGTADLEAKLLYANPALLRLLGLPSLDVARQYGYEDFYREEDLQYLRREVIPTVLAEGHWTGEVMLKPLDRDPVPTIHNLYLLRDDEGRPTAFSNVVTDIRAQKAIEQVLRASEAKYRQLFEGARDGIALADLETGELLDCNAALCRMVGRPRDELIGRSQRILHPSEPHGGEVTASFELHRSERHDEVLDQHIVTSTSEIRDVEIKANFVDLDGRTAMQGVFHDVTDRNRAEEALFEEKERAQVTLHSIGDAVITTDGDGRVNFLNPVAEKLTAWSLKEACGRELGDIFPIRDEDTDEPIDNPVATCLREGEIIDVSRPTILTGRDGVEQDVDASAAPIRRSDGTVLGAVLVFRDVGETRQFTRKMAYAAAHDPLTGLINRREFEERLEQALQSAHKFGFRHALCYIDLDQFKIVNDTAGHAAGDELLKQIKGVLDGTFRDRDTLARLGGDEFGLLLDNCPVERALSIAGRIIDVIREHRFVWQGKGFRIGASIGVAPIAEDTQSVAHMLSQADVACYTAKELGRNRVHVYHEKGGAPVRRHGEILQAAGLRDALDQGRFRLYCQPIVPLDQDEKESVRYEILLRLLDDDDRLVLPGTFIPAAERFGLMADLDRWVIRTAFRVYSADRGRQNTQISINLSGNSLNDESLLDYVRGQFDEFSLPPDRVCFEITETAAVHDLSLAGRFMSEMKRLGCQLALDDFGSGLSSLRYLKMLPVDYLKIDGSFVRGIGTDLGDHAIVSAVNQLAHDLGIRTIGEYAESQHVVDTLRSLGVDHAQGYAVGYPAPFTGAWADSRSMASSFSEST